MYMHGQNIFYKDYARKIILITVAIFLLQVLFLFLKIPFESIFVLDISKSFEIWRFFTPMFLHADLGHLFFNMVAIFFFGPFLESRIGSKKFLTVYLAGGIFANIISFIFYSIFGSGYYTALGASGAIMAILGTLIILEPHTKVFMLLIPIPMDLWIASIIWFLIDLSHIINPNSNVGGLAHIAGMLFGLGFGLFLKYKYKEFTKKIKKRRHLHGDDINDLLDRHL